ncbi:HTH_XRE domain containing protein [Microcystis phage MJing1]|nr:HTH_XRE domain containing protein [Microcystis phage MJing1]
MDRAWIRDALQTRGLTQRDLAKRWGISEASVARFIQGTESQDPLLSRAVTLADMLDMPLDILAQRLGLKAVGRGGLPPIVPGTAPALGTISMAPSAAGLRVLLHLDLPAAVAAQVVALLDQEGAKH